ncbi:MAG: hypothetical protein KKH29_06005 [Candidatus Omnitrophica bacterium]|nr:hypothetical protein [Candidatus Omnitrophota bacterium]MCG2706419.1 hypothetical protein [Candidatus Omnitrophota bacterium]
MMSISEMLLLLKRKDFWKVWPVFAFCLLLLCWFLKARVEFFKKESQKNLVLLDQILPGFNQESQGRLQQEIGTLKQELLNLSVLFDPKEKWLKEDYDLSILFVEDLSNITQYLKNKTQSKQMDFVDLGFPEKLPSEKEAISLLTQLYGLKEVLELGIDLGIQFESVQPKKIEKPDALSPADLARSYLELDCPKEVLIEFMIQLQDIIPKVCLDSFLIQSQDNSFEISLAFSNVLLNLDWRKKGKEAISGVRMQKLASQTDEDIISILRSNNPFFVTGPKEVVSAATGAPEIYKIEEGEKPTLRFFYRGKVILKGKEAVAMEDTLNKETVFLKRQQQYGNFKVVDFSDEELTLENIDNANKISVRKEEE